MSQASSQTIGAVEVTISPDQMQAWVRVAAASNPSQSQVNEALRAAGVRAGIIDAAIAQALKKKGEEAVLVAIGRVPDPGQDGDIVYLVDVPKGQPSVADDRDEDNDEPVEATRLVLVNAGDVLAKRVPSVPGKFGMTVMGEILAAAPVREARLVGGENTQVSEDGLVMMAAVAGQPVWRDDVLVVEPVMVIEGALTEGHGPINFEGTVRVNGDVLPGASIVAGRDIEVRGSVEACYLEAASRIVCWGGVRNEAQLLAEDSISVRFIESGSRVVAYSAITVLDGALNSTLIAGTHVRVGGKIMGGEVQAREYVFAGQLGSPSGLETKIYVQRAVQDKAKTAVEEQIVAAKGRVAYLKRTRQQMLESVAGGTLDVGKLDAHVTRAQVELATLESEARRLEHLPPISRRAGYIISRGGFNPNVQVYFDRAYRHFSDFSPLQRASQIEGKISLI